MSNKLLLTKLNQTKQEKSDFSELERKFIATEQQQKVLNKLKKEMITSKNKQQPSSSANQDELAKKQKKNISILTDKILKTEKEFQSAEVGTINNNFTDMKFIKKQELTKLIQSRSDLIKNYLETLQKIVNYDEKLLNTFMDSDDPSVVKKLTSNLKESTSTISTETKNLKDLIINESSRSSSKIKGPDSKIVESGLDKLEQHGQDKKNQVMRKQRKLQEQQNMFRRQQEQGSSMSIDTKFPYKIDDFRYIIITKGSYKSQYGSIKSYNPSTEMLYVELISTSTKLNIPKDSYKFVKILGENDDKNFISPSQVKHTSNKFVQDPKIFTDSASSSRRSSVSPMSSRRSSSPDFQLNFEEELRMNNASNLDITKEQQKYFVIINEILDILTIPVEALDMNEIIGNIEQIQKTTDVELSSKNAMKLLIASIIFATLNGTSIVPNYTYPNCPPLNWKTPNYFSCVLNDYIKTKKNTTLYTMIMNTLTLIGFKIEVDISPINRTIINPRDSALPVSSFKGKAVVKSPNFEKMMRAKSKGGPGPINLIDFDKFQLKGKRKRSSAADIISEMDRMSISPVSPLASSSKRSPVTPLMSSPKKPKFTNPLKNMTVKDLKSLAKENKIKKYSTLKKDDLVDALSKLTI